MKSRVKLYFSKYWQIYVSILLFIAVIALIVFPSLSEKVTSSVWDGSVANTFHGGSGTVNDPYEINDGAEFAYFVNVITENTNNYNLYYELTNNLDMNGYDFSNSSSINYFSGVLNGNGYTISNFTINNKKDIEDEVNYGIFNYLLNATIENINFSNITINVNDNNAYVGLLASKSSGTKYHNISLIDIKINSSFDQVYVGTILSKNEGNNTIQNVHIDCTSNKETNIISYESNETDTLSNVIALDNGLNNDNNVHLYSIVDKTIVFNNTDINATDMLNLLNDNNEYTWKIKNYTFKLYRTKSLIPDNNTYNEHKSEITDDIVYVNDLESDYNYYMGLNYTYSKDGKLPSLENKNIYNDNNLIKVQLTYDATDFNGYEGHVSITERQTKYIYYKYYPVTNGYIEIELIDNPFIDRPTDSAFNGWVTSNENAEIQIDMDNYLRYLKVYVGNEKSIALTLHASWITADYTYLNGNWNNAYKEIESNGFHEYKFGQEPIYSNVDLNGYYTQVTIRRWYTYSGLYDEYGNYYASGFCRTNGGCTMYSSEENNSYDETKDYYKLENGRMTLVNNDTEFIRTIIGYKEPAVYPESVVGLFTYQTISSGTDLNGYYDANGNRLTGTCNNSICNYYHLEQYYDKYGQVNEIQDDETYYYLTTRDTNIIVLNSTTTSVPSSSFNKPYTLTSVYNGDDYRDNVYLNINSSSFNIYRDTTIEYIKIYTTLAKTTEEVTPGGSGSQRTIYGRWNNLKIGRGIIQNGSYVNANAVVGGISGSTGSSSNLTNYTLRIESGLYNALGGTTGNSGSNIYVNAKIKYGNDYDRINNNNDLLEVVGCASGSWAGNIYSKNNTTIAVDTLIKSGKFGSNKYDYATGVYVGGRNAGTFYAPRRLIVEGGYIYNVVGGPLTAASQQNYNDTYIYQKGGYIDIVIGGAGRTETYGNRIIGITGGIVGYSVFGGSNGVEGSNSSSYLGTLSGTPYLYIGGNAIIGDEDNVTNNNIEPVSLTEAGSVFGIGNGREGYSSIGSADNSNIIIDGNALIRNNVYGGGNYGATGISSGNSSSETKIIINGGTIEGAIFGGGNNNGSGATNTSSKINITTNGGKINNIYGGSRVLGIVYGDVDIDIIDGEINEVYGGGYGGYTDSTHFGTFVTGNVDIEIGKNNSNPTIYGNVYGGSAFGTVNASTREEVKNELNVNVLVNRGKIIGSVFGGAKGNSIYIPYVKGNITVNINGGTIGSVFGGFDENGKPENQVIVYLNGGVIGSSFGGGNKTSIDETKIYLRGATTTYLYGGSNELGDVNNTNVYIEDGTAYYVFGGNNLGGTVSKTKVTTTGGTIKQEIYGGGNEVATTNTYLYLSGGNILDAYGGGRSADVDGTYVEATKDVTNIYGGSNTDGSVPITNLKIISGSFKNIYGGNNLGGTVIETKINVENGTIDNIYGGGNEVETNKTNITINDGSIINVYGGGNKAQVSSTSTNILGGTIANLFGGGNEGYVGYSHVTLNGGNLTNVYGGGNKAGADETNVELLKGIITNAYGGSRENGNVNKTNIFTNYLEEEKEDKPINQHEITATVSNFNETQSWENTNYKYSATLNVSITNNSSEILDSYEGYIYVADSSIASNYSSTELTISDDRFNFNQVNRYYGTNSINPGSSYSFEFTIYTNTDLNANEPVVYLKTDGTSNETESSSGHLEITSIYGGNDEGGLSKNTYVTIEGGNIGNVYGGGNLAPVETPIVKIIKGHIDNVYGGGNQASIKGNTTLNINGGTINENAYGGGNEGIVELNTYVLMNAGELLGSLYAGGKGTTAEVTGNTNITVSGEAIIGTEECTNKSQCGLYGGGKAAPTGNPTINNSNAIVNVAGGTIYGNVYGGANTSKVYGETKLLIGADVSLSDEVIKSPIVIGGTVFGGGEANESGDENYDFSFISVTKGITVLIDGYNYDLDIRGSIFGSGNASRTTGTSNVSIKNYGTFKNPKKNISIQRANLVKIDNSHMIISGATDRENDYSNVLFSLSRIDELDLMNNSTLFLENNANLLKVFKSLTSDGALAEVKITDDSVTKNVDNRLYMLEGQKLNIAKNQNVTDYGDVFGMTFFGMYKYKGDGSVSLGIYDKYNQGDILDWGGVFSNGSYVLGAHKNEHNLKVDGFYSNFMDTDTSTNKVDYIIPTSDEADYYMWVIGEAVVTYEIDLVASKYSTLGAVELPFNEFYKQNTSFNVLGFDYSGLEPGVSLVEERDIPRVAPTSDIADKQIGLTMKAGNTGWLTNGETSFISKPTNNIIGTKNYVGENSTNTPSMLFYLYHSKNLGTEGNLGTVQISIMVITKIDDLTSEAERILIKVNMSRALYTTNDYEAAITPGREYELFVTTETNITNKSSFSTYYSLFAEDTNVYKTGYKRALVSDFVLPLNTKITLIDLSGNKKKYYYYVITEKEVEEAERQLKEEGDIVYNLSKFQTMGAINSGVYYDDSKMNDEYYNSITNSSSEEFIFIFDFEDTNISEDILDKSILMELQDQNDQTLISVLGVEASAMKYNIYANEDATIEVNGNTNKDVIYGGESFTIDATFDFTQSKVGANMVYDTKQFNSKLGVKISIYNSNNEIISGTSLLGLYYEIDGVKYYPNIDGTTRIKLTEKVGNYKTWIKVFTENAELATGTYKIRLESFGSPDGIYYGLNPSGSCDVSINIINEIYGLDIKMDEESLIIDSKTGNNLKDTNYIYYQIIYNSGLNNPNIHVVLQRRKYDEIYDTKYETVDLQDYSENVLAKTDVDKEYLISSNPREEATILIKWKDNLKTGTYKLEFILYDGTTKIGSINKYIIIK